MDNDIELDLGKTLMQCNIRDGAKLQLKRTSSSEILTFTYSVDEGLGTRASSYTSVPTRQDSVYYETARATGNKVLKENMYKMEICENQKAECDGKTYNINATYTYTFELNSENIHDIYHDKRDEKKGIQIREYIYGTRETLIRVSSDSKTQTYYSTQSIANTYLLFPEESKEEYIVALASNGEMLQINNLGGGQRSLVAEF